MGMLGLMSLLNSGAVYHGSPSRLNTIRANSSGLFNGSSVIFASSDLWVAVASCGRWRDSDIEQGIVDGKPYMREMYEGAFKRVYSSGGYVYTLDAKTFKHVPVLASFELISEESCLDFSGCIFIEDPIIMLELLGVDLVYYS